MLAPGERIKIENLIGSYPRDVSPLSTAVLCDDAAAVDAELKRGADPDKRERSGKTPVLYAAALSRDAILRKLLDAGGDADAFDGANRLALSLAFSAGLHFDDWRAYYTLLERGADVNFSANGVSTVAVRAVALGRPDKATELLDRGYRHDLPGLAQSLENRAVTDDQLAARDAALARVRALITEQKRGTAVPR